MSRFPALLLDAPPLPAAAFARLAIPGVARVFDVFAAADLDGLPRPDAVGPMVLRVHDAAVLGRLEAAGLASCPVIVSALVDPATLPLGGWSAGLALEVADADDLARAAGVPADCLVGKSLEAPGPAKECTAFVLFQLLRRQDRPFLLHSYAGLEAAQALRAEGCAGLLLPASQRVRQDRLKRYRFPLDGRGALVRLELGGEAAELDRWQAALERDRIGFLRETRRAGLWEPGAEDLGAPGHADLLGRYLALWARTLAGVPPCASAFGPGSPYCARTGLALPVIQGPLSRISVSPDFAAAVAAAGGFPYLALAGMPAPEVDALLARMGEPGRPRFPYGVGLVSVVDSPAEFEALARVLEAHRPARVLIAAPQIDQVRRIERTGLELWVHAPTVGVYRALRGMGLTRFVLEGEESGGHISTTGSFCLWQDVLGELARDPAAEGVALAFAGGVASPEGVDLLSSLLHFHGLAGRVAVALHLGTAYLATEELVRLGPLGAYYQRQVVEAKGTLVTGETVGLRVRQVATDAVAKARAREWEIFRSDLSAEEKRKRIEAGYLGTLRKALAATGPVEGASFMAGAAVALLGGKATSVAELHRRLTRPRTLAAAVPGPEAGARDGIAVIGLGSVFPGSVGTARFFRDVLRKRCFIRDVPDSVWPRKVYLSDDRSDPLKSYSGIAGLVAELPFDSTEFRIPPSVGDKLDRSQRMALLAAREALEDAGLGGGDFPRARTAVILGNSMGGNAMDESQQTIHAQKVRERLKELAGPGALAAELERLFEAYDESYPPVEITEDTLPGELPNVIAGRVAWAFDLHGPNFVVDAACASSLAAVSLAVRALRDRECDLALTGGVDTQTEPGIFVKFSRLTALSATGSWPFDARGDGFVVGEGCGILVLKREADALRDGDRIYAVIRGVGGSSDGFGKGITAPNPDWQIQAMRRAWDDAGLDPAGLDYLECHGTGTPVGDAAELASVARLRAGATRPLAIGSVKAMIGHLKAGAGVAGLFKAVLAVNARALPPQVGFQRPHPAIEAVGSGIRVPTAIEPLEGERVVAAASAFGFGGTNFHVVVTSPAAGARPPKVDARALVLPRLPALAGELALVFPGQGSQYVGMGRELLGDPASDALLARADAVMAEVAGTPLTPLVFPPGFETLDEAGRERAEARLRDTAVAQPAIFAISAMYLERLVRAGLRPALVMGHSLGEYSALYAAGILGFEDALRAVSIRGRAMGEAGGKDPGAMAFVAADRERAEELCAAAGGSVVVANWNAYDQTVVSGETAAVERVVALATEDGLKARRLNVAAAFHSRLVKDAVPRVVAGLGAAALTRSAIPVPANLSRQVYPLAAPGSAGLPMDPAERARTVELLSRQIEEPVDWVTQVEVAYEAGVRRFLEVGPKNVLARLVEDVLAGKEFQALWVDHPRESARANLAALPGRLAEPVRVRREALPTAPAAARNRRKAAAAAPAAGLPLVERIRQVVAEVSGYRPEDIADTAEFEKDLGIDTLKIFEIFSRLKDEALGGDPGSFRQLTSIAKIVARAAGGGAGPAPGPAPAPAGGIRTWRLETAPGPRLPEAGGAFVIEALGAPTPARPGAPTILHLRLPATGTALVRDVLPRLHARLVAALAAPAPVAVISTAPEDGFREASYQALAGFLKSAAKDLPALALGYDHLDLPPGASAPEAGMLARVAASRGAWRRVRPDGGTQVLRLVPTEPAPASLAGGLATDDLVLVTGGARGIAAGMVRRLLAATPARFLLVGRAAGVEPWIAAEAGRVEYLACDLADPAAVAAAGFGRRPVTHLIHAAGIEVSRGLDKKTPAELAAVLAPKVLGLEALLAALDPARLRAVVTFSSIAALFGNHGQADYAAANGWLQGLALPGCRTLSIAWGAWKDVGMAARGPVKDILAGAGVEFLAPDQGVALFERLFAECLGRGGPGREVVAVFGELGPGFVLPGDPILPGPAPALKEVGLPAAGRVAFTYRFDLEASPYLKDHRLNREYYLPAVSMLRQILKRLEGEGRRGDLRLGPMRFLAPVVFRDREELTFGVERRGDEYLLETARGRVTTPVASLGVAVGAVAPAEADEVERLKERVLARGATRLVPFEPRAREKGADEIYKTYFHGPAFRVLTGLEGYNGRVIRAGVDLRLADRGGHPLGEQDRVPFLLEAMFHAAGLVTLLDGDCAAIHVPSTLERAWAWRDRCRAATRATIHCEIVERGSRKRFDAVMLDQDGRVMMAMVGYHKAKSPEEVFHKKALLVPSSPVVMDESQVMLLDLEEAAAWGEAHLAEVYTAAERAEIESKPVAKRRNEKLAGKLAAKILAREALKAKVRREYPLRDFEVLSEDAPVAVAFRGPGDFDAFLAGKHFSISHTEGLAVASCAGQRGAVDVEKLRVLQPGTVKSIMSDRLMRSMDEWLAGYADRPDLVELYRVALPLVAFTQKEAVLKAAGVGIGGGLENVEIDELSLGDPVVARFRGERYRVLSIFDEVHVLTVARLEGERRGERAAS